MKIKRGIYAPQPKMEEVYLTLSYLRPEIQWKRTRKPRYRELHHDDIIMDGNKREKIEEVQAHI